MQKTKANYNLRPGDKIVSSKSDFQIINHHALYIGFDETRTDWVFENNINSGVQIITAQAYFAEVRKIARIERFGGSNAERKQAVRRALRLAGKPYDLINYNCEHFANEVLTGRVESKQVEKAFMAVLGLLLFGLFVNE